MSIALRPLLRTSSSPTITITITNTTTINPSIPPQNSYSAPLRPPFLQQTRHANILRRPKRPFLLPQIILLSDGSAYTQLTTSPRGVIRSTKDVRNHPLWNPTLHRLMDVEEDEAGRLRAFRERFGRGWDNRELAEKERGERGKEKGKIEGGEVTGVVEAKKGGAEQQQTGVAAEGEKPQEPVNVEEVEEGGLVDLLSAGYEQAMANRAGKKKKPGSIAAAAAAAAAAAQAAAKPAPAAGGKKKK